MNKLRLNSEPSTGGVKQLSIESLPTRALIPHTLALQGKFDELFEL